MRNWEFLFLIGVVAFYQFFMENKIVSNDCLMFCPKMRISLFSGRLRKEFTGIKQQKEKNLLK